MALHFAFWQHLKFLITKDDRELGWERLMEILPLLCYLSIIVLVVIQFVVDQCPLFSQTLEKAQRYVEEMVENVEVVGTAILLSRRESLFPEPTVQLRDDGISIDTCEDEIELSDRTSLEEPMTSDTHILHDAGCMDVDNSICLCPSSFCKSSQDLIVSKDKHPSLKRKCFTGEIVVMKKRIQKVKRVAEKYRECIENDSIQQYLGEDFVVVSRDLDSESEDPAMLEIIKNKKVLADQLKSAMQMQIRSAND